MVDNYMGELRQRIEAKLNPQQAMGPKAPPPPPRGLVKPPKPIALSQLQQQPPKVPSKFGFIEGNDGVPADTE